MSGQSIEKSRQDSCIKGKVFISTRPSGKSEVLKSLFRAEGARLYEMPVIQLQAETLDAHQKKISNSLESFDWLLFTSSNAVKYFIKQSVCEIPPDLKIISIGEKTTRTIEDAGYKTYFTGKDSNRESLAGELKKLAGRKKPSVLWPTGNLSPDSFVHLMQDRAELKRVNVYRTFMPDSIDEDVAQIIREDSYEIIFFYSASAVRFFCSLFREHLNLYNIRTAAIGKTTENELLNYGITPLFLATEPGSEGFLEATKKYYLNKCN